MSTHDDDEIIAAAREGFLDEAQEMLAQFEQALLVMESDPHDSENLNAAFRAAHTIKGSAGLFGFDAVVAFTHEAETLLEELRSGQIQVDEHVTAVLLQSRDQMALLLDELRTGIADPSLVARSAALGAELRALLPRQSDDAHDVDLLPDGADVEATLPARTGPAHWQISLRFGADALRNGLDPLAFLRYLATLGEVLAIETLADAVPALVALDPEGCCLGFEIRFQTEASREQIADVFDFCASDCDIALLGPDASLAEHLAVLERHGGDAAVQATLLALWQRQGLVLPARPLVANTMPSTASGPLAGSTVADQEAGDHAPEAAAQLLDRRGPAPERRENEAERRDGARERRGGEEARFIRVRADKLDRLIDQIGELVIASSGAQLVAQNERSQAFAEAALRIHDLVQDARDGALSLRMVPIGETFARFNRVVRDVCKQLGKDVELHISGGDTELDKSMVETLSDPLMHLVRNSLDHGVEPADERIANGKPAQGRLGLHAYHESGAILIEVSDDGRGLNRERILARAIERGLVAPDSQLTPDEIHHLIFAPGFSTAEVVTNLSGRGVGMDVVKRNIEQLRGHIRIASQPGLGSTMQIRLPLTLAIIDGFLTSVGNVHYVVPLETVVECIESPPVCRIRQPSMRLSGHFDLRGEVLSYIDLRTCFQTRGERPTRQSMLVARTTTGKVGLLVDRLLGEHQTVLKPLGAVFQQLPGIAGSTILGSGEVALVLDVPTLLDRVTPPPIGRSHSAAAPVVAS